MGKKGHKSRSDAGRANTCHPNDDLKQDVRRLKEIQVGHAEAEKRLDEISRTPLSRKGGAIRRLLADIGTDLSENDDDPMGDGDQTPIATHGRRNLARHLFSSGGAGDIYDHISQRLLSTFALGCTAGNLEVVGEMVKCLERSEPKPYSKSLTMRALLEARETSMRFSPLLLVVSAGKTIVSASGNQDFQGIAKLLLKYGASPVAKDVLGKTVD
ncbi:hypothetical protein ACHAWF_012802 [Thalassiosira exigua]